MSVKKKVTKRKKLTAFGEYLAVRSVNKSDVARKVGISLTRVNRLCYDEKSYLRAYELQLIALAINIEPEKMQKDLFGNLKLKEEISPSEKIIANTTSTLTEKNLIEKHELTVREIERIIEILSFCGGGRTDDEIISHIDLKRKSPKFQAALKATVEVGWLTLEQKHIEGTLISTYTTTEKGKEIVKVV